jgi:hypothetical protein
VLSPEIEDRDEVATGRSRKRLSTLNDIYILLYSQADHKKKSEMNSLIYFSFPAVTILKFAVFKF